MTERPEVYVGDTDPLDLLEAKIKILEVKLFGAEGLPNRSSSTLDAVDIVDVLMKSQTVMNTAISSQDKITKMVKRMGELDAVLDPSFENITMRDAAKVEMLLLMYNDLHDLRSQLKLLQESSDVLNSEQIRNVPNMEERLNALVKLLYENKNKVEESNRNVRDLLTNYNRLVNSFTKTFARLDDVVKDLEIGSEVKKVLE